MLFDVQSALAEILSEPMEGCDSCDSRDTTPLKSQESRKSQRAPAQFEGTSQRTRLAVVSQKSRVSQPPHADIPASGHAKRSTDAKAYPHGTTPSGRPVTWTGKVVSLAQWRELSDWERHGPQGRVWDGQADQWVET